MRKTPPLIASLLLACTTAQLSTSQTRRGRSRVRPQSAAPSNVAAGAERAAASPQSAGPRLVVQLGQRTSLYGFAVFSSDSRLLATGGGGDAVVWDVGGGREVRRFVGNEGEPGAQDLDGLTGGAFSPDNSLLAVSVGPNLRLWDVETGRLVWKRANDNAFLKQESSHPPVVFTNDGKRVVVRGDGAVMTWDVETGRLVSRALQEAGRRGRSDAG